MFMHPRLRFAPLDLRVTGGTAPRMRWLGCAARGARFFVAALITTGLLCGNLAIRPALGATQPPIGFERWTNPDADSGVDFGLTVEQVFQKYAASLAFGGIPQQHTRKDKRLIDIEVRADDSGLAHYVYDVVWVKDEGDFMLESWFVPGLTEAELHQLPQLAPQGIVAVDVERYPKGNEWRYSAILQRNAGKFGWEVLTDAALDEVVDTAKRRGMRLLDLDYATPGPLDCPTVPGQACALASFDAMLVANSGANAIETKLWFNMTEAQIATKQDQGYQIIDWEDGGESLASVWVRPGLPFELQPNLAANDVIFENNHHGRVVDLEQDHLGLSYTIVNLGWSAAPASPGLADAQQNGDTGGHQAKPDNDNDNDNDKVKGKSERDRKPKGKGKKGGQRARHGKGRNR